MGRLGDPGSHKSIRRNSGPKAMQDKIIWLDLARRPYSDAWTTQESLHAQVVANALPGALLFQENPPTITVGAEEQYNHLLWQPAELESAGIELIRTGRGGDITYHGPGQLVASPILRFRQYAKTAHDYLCMLEETALLLLQSYGIRGERIDGKTGVFVGGAKIAFIGVSVRRMVTQHGLSINVSPELKHFEAIIPCGLCGLRVTSLEELGVHTTITSVRDRYLNAFGTVFEVELEEDNGKD